MAVLRWFIFGVKKFGMRFCFFISLLLCCHFSNGQLLNLRGNNFKTDTVPVMLEPVCKIDLIRKGNTLEYADSLSLKASDHLLSIINRKPLDLGCDSLVRFTNLSDTSLLMALQYEMEISIPEDGVTYKILPPTLDSVLTDLGKRYAYIIYQKGFTRMKGNYRGQVWTSIGIGVLSMGSYINEVRKTVSDLYLFKLDGTRKTIQCIRKQDGLNMDPFEEKKIDKEVGRLLLWNKNK